MRRTADSVVVSTPTCVGRTDGHDFLKFQAPSSKNQLRFKIQERQRARVACDALASFCSHVALRREIWRAEAAGSDGERPREPLSQRTSRRTIVGQAPRASTRPGCRPHLHSKESVFPTPTFDVPRQAKCPACNSRAADGSHQAAQSAKHPRLEISPLVLGTYLELGSFMRAHSTLAPHTSQSDVATRSTHAPPRANLPLSVER